MGTKGDTTETVQLTKRNAAHKGRSGKEVGWDNGFFRINGWDTKGFFKVHEWDMKGLAKIHDWDTKGFNLGVTKIHGWDKREGDGGGGAGNGPLYMVLLFFFGLLRSPQSAREVRKVVGLPR